MVARVKILITTLAIIFLFLQYKLWFERDSVAGMLQLKKEIAVQQKENNNLLKRNEALIAEVKDLKHGKQAIENRARNELGMIKKGERFYQIVGSNSSS